VTIPRIIHQTATSPGFKSKNDIHPVLQANIEKNMSLNPSYVHRLYDDQDIEKFILEHYGRDMYSLYRQINPLYGAAKADFFRYLLIYKVGGIYLDIKSSIERNLDEILTPDDNYILSTWHNREGEFNEGWGMHPGCFPLGEYQQWHIISRPEHPFLQAVIKSVIDNIRNYDKEIFGVGTMGVVNTTGPVAYTRAIFEMLDYFNVRDFRRVKIEFMGIRYSNLGVHHKELVHTQNHDVHYSLIDEPVVLPVSKVSPSFHRRRVFNSVYRDNKPGAPGADSTNKNTVAYREFLQKFLIDHEIKTVLDVGCGDWNFSRLLDWSGIKYVGIDVSDLALERAEEFSSDNIKFYELDAISCDLPDADLVILKDVIQYWSNNEILEFLPKLKKFKKVLVVGSMLENDALMINHETTFGEYHDIDLSQPPFALSGSNVFFFEGKVWKYVYLIESNCQ
jgi:hypothetical protein